MNLEQLKARMAEIMGKLEALNGAESFEESQIDEVNALSEEYEKIEKQIEAQERVAALTAKAATSTRKVAPATSAVKIEMGKDRLLNDPKGGFKTAGEFFKTVKNQTFGQNDNRLQILAAGAYEKVAEDGGFLIPEDFRLEIQKKCDSDESLLAKCRQLKTNSNHLSLPTNESAPWDGTGIQAYWEGEGATLTESKAKFSKSNWHLHKLTALVRVSDELMDDASALGSWINAEAPAAIMHKINSAIISGSGAGMPTGFLNSGFKYEVAKQGSQAADTVVFENVNNMVGRLLPGSKARAVWIVNPAVLPLLPLMKFDSSASSPVPVYLPATGVSGASYGTLYGMPILPMMGGSKALGDTGDISLVDLSYYYAAVKTAGIKSDISTHVYFLSGEQAFRFTTRLDGHCPYKAPITTENGNFQMSGFVTLQDRA